MRGLVELVIIAILGYIVIAGWNNVPLSSNTHNVVFQGYISAYSEQKTIQVINNRQSWGQIPQELDKYILVAVENCAHIGKFGYISHPKYGKIPIMVFDCAEPGAEDGQLWMQNNKIAAEIDWSSWQKYPELVHSWQEIRIESVVLENKIAPIKHNPGIAEAQTVKEAVEIMFGGTRYSCSQCTLHGIPGWAGYDYTAGCGARLHSPINGVITYYGLDGYNHSTTSITYEQATMVEIKNDNGRRFFALHLQIFDKDGNTFYSVGDKINVGDTIGFEDSYGWSTGCHVHMMFS